MARVIFSKLQKIAKSLGRYYMDDITEAKKQLIESGKVDERMFVDGTK